MYNHHLELGCEDDPTTFSRGRSIYVHLPKSYFGQSKFLFTMEKQRLRRLGVPFLSWIESLDKRLCYVFDLQSVLFWYVGGWTGISHVGLLWLISNFELEVT